MMKNVHLSFVSIEEKYTLGYLKQVDFLILIYSR